MSLVIMEEGGGNCHGSSEYKAEFKNVQLEMIKNLRRKNRDREFEVRFSASNKI